VCVKSHLQSGVFLHIVPPKRPIKEHNCRVRRTPFDDASWFLWTQLAWPTVRPARFTYKPDASALVQTVYYRTRPSPIDNTHCGELAVLSEISTLRFRLSRHRFLAAKGCKGFSFFRVFAAQWQSNRVFRGNSECPFLPDIWSLSAVLPESPVLPTP